MQCQQVIYSAAIAYTFHTSGQLLSHVIIFKTSHARGDQRSVTATASQRDVSC